MDALNKAIDKIGSQSALAAAINGTPQLVNNWLRRGGVVPEDYCPIVERATNACVTCEELRPDVVWVRIPDKSWPHPKGRPLEDHAAQAA